jgi:hypothetical protein
MCRLIKKGREISRVNPAAITPAILADLESRGYIVTGFSKPRLAASNQPRARQ